MEGACDNCGYDQSGANSEVCVECGVSRGSLRFATAPADYVAGLSRAFGLLQWSRIGLLIATRALGVALLVEPVLTALSVWWASSAGWLSFPQNYIDFATSLERTALTCAMIATVVSLPTYWLGLHGLARAARFDTPLSRATRYATFISLAATAVATTLVGLDGSSASRLKVFGLESIGCTCLAAQLWTIARVRVILARRAGREAPNPWLSATICLAIAVALSALFASPGDRLLSPVMILIFLLGLSRELRLLRMIGRGLKPIQIRASSDGVAS